MPKFCDDFDIYEIMVESSRSALDDGHSLTWQLVSTPTESHLWAGYLGVANETGEPTFWLSAERGLEDC